MKGTAKRYRANKAPQFLHSFGEDEEDEAGFSLKPKSAATDAVVAAELKPEVETERTKSTGRRRHKPQIISEHQEDAKDGAKSAAPESGSGRRRHKPQIISEAVESTESTTETTKEEVPMVQDAGHVMECINNNTHDINKQNVHLASHSHDSSSAANVISSSNKKTDVEDEVASGPSSSSDEEEEEEYPIGKISFVSKAARKNKEEQRQLQLENEWKSEVENKKKREELSRSMAKESIERQNQVQAESVLDDDRDMPDDSLGDDEEEYEAWKVREALRVQKYFRDQ